MHHPRRWNVTTSVVWLGKKTKKPQSHTKKSRWKWWIHTENAGEYKKKKKKNLAEKESQVWAYLSACTHDTGNTLYILKHSHTFCWGHRLWKYSVYYKVSLYLLILILPQSLALAARERGQGADEEDSERSNLPLPGENSGLLSWCALWVFNLCLFGVYENIFLSKEWIHFVFCLLAKMHTCPQISTHVCLPAAQIKLC